MKKTAFLIITLLGSNIVFSQYDINGNYKISGDVGVGTDSPSARLHIFESASGLTPTNVSGLFVENSGNSNLWYVFQTATIGGGKSFSITNAGNVGIGTSTPGVKLDIAGTGTSTTITRISSGGHANYRVSRGSNSYDGGLLFYTGATLDWRLQESANGNDLHIRDESMGTNIVTFENNTGNVGIGVANPQMRLSVDGFIKAQGSDGRLMLENPSATNSLYIRNNGVSGQRKLEIMYGGTIKYVMDNDGNVGIGTDTPQSKLAVNGQIRATEVKVLTDVNSVPDYVFEPDYELRTLKETKEYIATNKHLPEIPSAKEMEENGIALGDMNMRLLKKIEELTLYQIELMEEMEAMKKELKELKK